MKISLGDLKYLRRISEGYFRTIPAAPNKPDPRHWRDDQLTLSWLGHATVLINFFGVWILTDPALRARVGVRVGPLTFGPKRYVAPALRTSELPPLDFILLTHAHMDHLDLGTLRRLRRDVTVVTAAATADLLTPMRFRDVVEMGWGESRQFDTPHGGLSIEAFRVQHWGARMRHDVHRGFNGYVLERHGRRICIAGDTARTSFTAVGQEADRRDGGADRRLQPLDCQSLHAGAGRGDGRSGARSICRPGASSDVPSQLGADG